MNRAGNAKVSSAQVTGPRRDYSRWRAGTLILVYVLMAAHVTHWLIAGKTLAPLELNEVMYTLEFGIVTAGFLFMLGVTLMTAIIGRAFCSWGCHILALQDLCAWLLKKMHIKPKVVRSRVLLLVPVIAALYMFVWPQAVRVYRGDPLPELHLRTDAEGWASLATQNFWRNLPGPVMTVFTFLTCGFLIVYVMGSRGFCIYGCPYGAVFRLADKIAPARIRARGDDCLSCGACTAACLSHVRVHEELNRFGMVVNSACLRDMDCVAACPKGNVYYGFGLPSLLKSVHNPTPIRKAYDFTIWEEVILCIVFIFVVFIYRGLYDQIPFLLSLALAVIIAYLVVVWARLIHRTDVQVIRRQLKVSGRLTGFGVSYCAVMVALMLLTLHSGYVHYQAIRGRALAIEFLQGGKATESLAMSAIAHLRASQDFGLLKSHQLAMDLSQLHYRLAGECFRSQRTDDAEQHLRAAISERPDHALAHYDLGALLLKRDRRDEAISHLRATTRLKPDFADGHYNLAVALWMAGAYDEARAAMESAYQLNAADPQIQQLRTVMIGQMNP